MQMLRGKKIDYKWAILVAGFLMVFTCLGFCGGNNGLFLPAITDATGIKRSLYSFTTTFRYIATTFANLFFGTLTAKFGARKLIAFGFAVLAVAMFVFSQSVTLTGFYIGGFLMGIGLSFTSTTMGSYIVKKWFTSNIGRYTGIVLASNGIGAATASQLISPILFDESNPFGYQTVYAIYSIILIVVGIVVVALLKESPKDSPIVTDAPKKKQRGVIWHGIEYSTLLKRPYFYATALCVFLTGLFLQGVSIVKYSHMRDLGIDATTISLCASISSVLLTASKIALGMLYDKKGLKPVLLICHGLTVLSFILLIFITPSATGIVLSLAASFTLAFAIPLETIMVPLMINDLFGSVSYEKLLGILMAFNTAGFAIGSPLVNLSYDIWGSYLPLFYVSIAVMSFVMICMQIVIQKNKVEKDAIIASFSE